MTGPSENSTGDNPPPDDHRRAERPPTDLPPWMGTPPADWKLALGALGYAALWVCAFEIDIDAVKIATSICILLGSVVFVVTVARRERHNGQLRSRRRRRANGIPRELRHPLMLQQLLAVAFSLVVGIVVTRTLHTALTGSAMHWPTSGAFVAIWAFTTIRSLRYLAMRSYNHWLDKQQT